MPVDSANLVIAIVDDEKDVRNLMMSFVEIAGMRPVAFESCESLRHEIAGGKSFDLIVTDKQLFAGDLNGICCAKKLSAQGVKTPVIVVTGESQVNDPEMPDTVKKILPKPFGLSVFQSALEEVIAKTKLSSIDD